MRLTMKEAGSRYAEEVKALRRRLHRHPELSGQEHGIAFTTGYAKTGVLGGIL